MNKNYKNNLNESINNPSKILNEKIILGLDEAGRGPVLGPMVISVVKVTEKDLDKINSLDLKDSKQLTKKRREEYYNIINECFEVQKIVLAPEKIDEYMKTSNLNKIELSAFSKLSNHFLKEYENVKIFIDACSSSEQSFLNQFKAKLINKKVEIIAEHKADEKYKIVSAASIIAKVTRDNIIESYKEEFGDIGSGYPGDPKTKEFLKRFVKEHKKLPKIARGSWATSKKLLKEFEESKLHKWVK
ncbi:ribonuclease HII [Methanococcus vannielii SB]|uniref:Ribonuclease HII n=1 Tax=Methanococcus vannielii (strain ATCC 35089 / DSM 1224 / JCM 13029 / OCM 148 / SB) TaxID=406327 RepID=RNH2_METVS|nr:ribonuclease HII [Methanococcus vannielii]A6UQ18.1 RecName: Full=Ribonuclease HII; Short=RNase HII [Methanococcus vannielii SB]ABR54590.1 ribonuclease HII [Methanococcus vannielii SB]